MQVSILFAVKFSLSRATLLTALIKCSIFVIGLSIIGFFETITSLPSCHSTSSSLPPVFQFQLWLHIEAYTDYRDLYLRCLVSPYLSGFGTGPLHLGDPYHLNNAIVYNYPPLFIYLIAGFAASWNNIWYPAVPLVLFDILTVIPLYLIAKEFVFAGNEKMAFAVSMIWATNPLNLFYNDLMWLNTAPTTFFLVLGIYFFLKKNWLFSSLALAVSTGLKQISVVLFPVFLIFLASATGFSKKLILYAVSYVALLILISTPYIFTEPQNYFWSLNFPILGLPPGASNSPPSFSSSLGDPVRITTFIGFISSNLGGFVSTSYQYLDYVLLGAFVAFLAYLVIVALTRHGRGQESFSSNEILVYCFVAFLIFFALFGRGMYKYYFASVTPLAIPLFKSKFGAVVFEVLSLVILLAPREVTPWMAILMLTLAPKMLDESGVPKLFPKVE
jgi:hypothetical protein